MNTQKKNAEKIMSEIRKILNDDWDPIGVMDDPDWPRDEYDRYIGGLYNLISSGTSAEAIAQHLFRIEQEQIGLGGGTVESRLPVAEKLAKLNVSAQA